LEPYAAAKAMPHIDEPFLKTLEDIHHKLIEAERTKDYPAALQYNYDFHFAVHRQSEMPHLIEMIERLWIQAGPLLNLLYPHGHPTYEGQHQHVNAIAALRAKDEAALRRAFEQDLIEGGRKFVEHLAAIESKEGAEEEPSRRSRP
ncbi:GntR family transcriptional regulator, partial [Mesorhizobium sp. M2A.F.Ca.ET.037.01.1.1]